MDPLRQITSPVAEVRVHAQSEHDEYNETWMMIDGVETKVPSIAAAQALCAKQDGIRVAIRAALDETGIREKSVFNEELGYEVLPIGTCGVFQIDLTRPHVPSAHDGDIIEPVPVVAPWKLNGWQRLKRAAKRLIHKKGRR